MKSEVLKEIEVAKGALNWKSLKAGSAALFVLGAAAFLYEIFAGDPRRGWSAYLTNYVYWTGLAFGTFLLSPILVVTNATWGRPVKRIAESAVFFMPVAFILFWPLFLGRETVFWWVLHPDPQKAPWLNTPFFFLREGLAILAMTTIAWFITQHSVKGDLEHAGQGAGLEENLRAQSKLSTVFVVLYAFILSLIGFDLIMSLDHAWVSSLFGAYYFAISFYAGLALLAILSAFGVKKMAMGEVIRKKQFHDIGKLLFAFCVVGMDFFYVQFLVIWYGNLPEETRYVLARVVMDPWAALAWTVLIVCFLVPFVVLVFRRLKMKPVMMTAISLWILIGVWLEKFLLVTPSIVKAESLPLGIPELLITVGWLGLFAFCVLSFFEKYPVVAISDPKLETALEMEGVHLA